MSDLTADKWTELAAQLDAELARTQQAGKAASSKANKLTLVALVLAAICFTLAGILRNTWWGMVAATPPGLLTLVTISYVLRNRQLSKQAQSDIERIQRDIRQWKKKKLA